jgi:excisionase family DNA binding protein
MARQEQKVVRVGAAAHELGLHPMTVWRWIKAGRIQVIQVGRQVRVPRSEIERIVGSVDGRLLLLYGRVSGRGQLDDLATHLQRLQGWAKAERKGMETLVLSDIGSGLKAARLVQLWPYLDDFMAERAGPAWKQVVELIGAPFPHGNRQWRCEAETAGRIMRAQAARKQVFQLIQPILSDGFIRPKTSTRPAGKNRKTIKEALLALQKTLVDDETAFITMQNVVEQACNSFLEHGEFPTTYEQMQSVPLLSVGLLT